MKMAATGRAFLFQILSTAPSLPVSVEDESELSIVTEKGFGRREGGV